MKDILGKIHLWGGLVSGIIVFIVSVTGCLFVYESEIRSLFHSNYLFVTPQTSPKLTPEQLALNLSRYFPSKEIEQIRYYQEANRAILVKVVPKTGTPNKGENSKESYTLNPYTGALLSPVSLEHDFLHYVEEIHTSLMMGEVGKWIIKINVVTFFFMLLTGLYLWWPRKKNQRKTAYSLQLKGKKQLVNYSIHNVLGFYFLLPLLVICLTGIWWAIKPVQKFTYTTLGHKMKGKEKLYSTVSQQKIFSLDKTFGEVSHKFDGWHEAHISFPKKANDYFKINLKYPYEVYKKSNIFMYDQYSGQLLDSEMYKDYNLADKLKHSNRDLHTGQNYGFFGKLLAFLASLYAATLPITGFLIWYFRKYKKNTKTTRKQMVARPKENLVALN